MAPVVSILSITFNQKKYIRQTLDSFLMQKTDFPFEILIHDDASTDGTTEILKEYAEKNPDIIKLYLEEENQYSKANFDFIRDLYINAKGKYIAFCEGDDYWTDETKLQRQVNLMEANPDYALSFHKTKVVFEGGEEVDVVYPQYKVDFDTNLLLKENFIQSNSVMYRRQDYKNLPVDVMPGDWYAHLYHAQYGKIGFIDRVMSYYRRHEGGVWWVAYKNPARAWVKYSLEYINFQKHLINIYGKNLNYLKIIKDNISSNLDNLTMSSDEESASIIASVASAHPVLFSEYTVQLHERLKNSLDALEKINQEYLDIKSSTVPKADFDSTREELDLILNSKTWKLRDSTIGILEKMGIKQR